MSRKINLLSISGGKDSTAMLLHAIERGVEFQCCFADTGHEHADVYEYLDYLRDKLGIEIKVAKADFAKRIEGKAKYIQEHWADDGIPDDKIQLALDTLKPTRNPFLDLCIWKGRFPSALARFCTDELKVEPITNQIVLPILKSGMGVRSWQGVRKEESPRRATYPMHELLDYRVWAYRPLLEWTAEDVFAIHHKHGVKPNPLYLKGMNRVGCMPCIMCRKGELLEISRRFPEVIERLKVWEKIVSSASKRGEGTFFPVKNLSKKKDNICYTTDGIESAVKWARTERGGKQFNLFTEFEDIPECSSNYGLCEFENDEKRIEKMNTETKEKIA